MQSLLHFYNSMSILDAIESDDLNLMKQLISTGTDLNTDPCSVSQSIGLRPYSVGGESRFKQGQFQHQYYATSLCCPEWVHRMHEGNDDEALNVILTHRFVFCSS